MRVLIIKISSMGDIIHTLPAVTDASKAVPGVQFDWLVEPMFAEIPGWHPAVQNVIHMPLREWRKHWLTSALQQEITKFIDRLRSQKYDMVIDAQGLLKSSLIARLCKSKIYSGLAWQSAREPLASIFYTKKNVVPVDMHAIERLRLLFAKALNYTLPAGGLDYGINWQKFPGVTTTTNKPYLFFLHGTTWDTKHWPETYWLELTKLAGQAGYNVYMTWATEEQKARVERLAQQSSAITKLPSLTISAAVNYLKGAKGVVAVDTGFGHLAAALTVPMVSLYGPTEPNKVGTFGARQISLYSKISCAPCSKRTCIYPENGLIKPKCFVELTPHAVWTKLLSVMD